MLSNWRLNYMFFVVPTFDFCTKNFSARSQQCKYRTDSSKVNETDQKTVKSATMRV